MKSRLLLSFSVVAVAFTLLVGPMTAAAPAAPEGFVPLFNGRNFDGWKLKLRSGDAELARRVFTVGEGGIVHVYGGLPDGFELNAGVNSTHGMMYTTKSFRRYILRFDYKWGTKRLNNFDKYQYEAGLYYHVSDDKIWPTGIEYQVRYNHVTGQNHTGDFWGSGFQWYADEAGCFRLPGDGGRLKSRKRGEHRAKADASFHALDGQWNTCEVIVMGDHYAIHKLNGRIVNLATGLSVKEGIIGLQAETAELFYRNIMIKELAQDLPLEEALQPRS